MGRISRRFLLKSLFKFSVVSVAAYTFHKLNKIIHVDEQDKTNNGGKLTMITVPELPYAKDALSPHISEETIDYHYGKHHQTYAKNLNNLLPGTEFEGLPLLEIIKRSYGKKEYTNIFNNAAQIWNHTFYWESMSPNGGSKPTGAIAEKINKSFKSFDDFVQKFSAAGATLFGSGWVWLIDEGNEVSIRRTSNADMPISEKPLLVMDVWEHAYYIDSRNARPKYIDNFFNVVNWENANKLIASSNLFA